jgi:hypothetical protein
MVALVKQKNKQSPLFLVKFDQKIFPKIYPNQRLSTIWQKSKQMSCLDICFASMNRPQDSTKPLLTKSVGDQLKKITFFQHASSKISMVGAIMESFCENTF